MSPRDSTDRLGPSLRAKPDVYTTMLAVAVVALLVAIVLLVLEWRTYDFDTSAALMGVLTDVASPRPRARHTVK